LIKCQIQVQATRKTFVNIFVIAVEWSSSNQEPNHDFAVIYHDKVVSSVSGPNSTGLIENN
jgi:hypothetical protein